jgi:hypothetical protein
VKSALEGICVSYETDQYRSIKEAAYELYVQKGRLDGDDLSDWFQAETMVREYTSPAVGEGASRRKAAPKSNKKRKTK